MTMLAVGLKKFHEGCYERSDFLDRTLSLGLDETVSCKWHTTGCFHRGGGAISYVGVCPYTVWGKSTIVQSLVKLRHGVNTLNRNQYFAIVWTKIRYT